MNGKMEIKKLVSRIIDITVKITDRDRKLKSLMSGEK